MNRHAIGVVVVGALLIAGMSACSGSSLEPTPGPTVTATPEPDVSFTPATYPRVDGSTATQPLGLAFREAFTDSNLTPEDVPFSKTHQAYLNLIDGNADLILVTSPSPDELAAAAAAGKELEVIPVVHEGFVFITNAGNPVTSLTADQLRDIYAGRIKNWNEVGGPNRPIVAYQRPANSGSQTGILDLVMKGTPMMKPPMEAYVISDMEGTVDAVASYHNSGGALGYSYYYFVTAMYGDLAKGNVQDGVRLMSVNGVPPREDTIRSGAYPLSTAYYIVIDKAAPAASPARTLARAMLSIRGQMVAQRAGYIPIAALPPIGPPVYTPPAGPFSLASATEKYRSHELTITQKEEMVSGRTKVARLTIDGLANQQVEDAINARFRQLQDAYVADHHPETLWGFVTNQFFGYSGQSGSGPTRFPVFGNVLSLEAGYGEGLVSLNVRLDTGEELAFRDLFVDGAGIEGILASAYRGHLLRQNRADPNDLEAQVLDMLGDYRRNPNPSFYLSSAESLEVRVGDREFEVRLQDYWQSIAIYKRFVTTSDARLYASNAGMSCPAFTAPYFNGADTTCEKLP